MSRLKTPMTRRIASAAFFTVLGATVVGFGIANADNATPSNDPAPVEQHAGPRLTDTQIACLRDKGITKPEPGTEPTQAQRDAMRQAAQDCGITLPMRHRFERRFDLTDAQKACLQGKGLERPQPGTRPTDAQRQAFRQAAQDCGITLPDRPMGPGMGGGPGGGMDGGAPATGTGLSS